MSDVDRREIEKDKSVIVELVFGSNPLGEKYRDIDICFVLDKLYSDYEMTGKRMKYALLLSSKFDVSVFQ